MFNSVLFGHRQAVAPPRPQAAQPRFASRALPADSFQPRFGSLESEGIKTPPATEAKLAALAPRLPEGTDWTHHVILDCYAGMAVGTDYSFTLDGKRYTLRDVFEDDAKRLPEGLEWGSVLIEESKGETKTYPMDYKTTFLNFWSIFRQTANPALGELIVSELVDKAWQLWDAQASAYVGGSGSMRFKIDEENWRLNWNPAENDYSISVEQPISREELKKAYEATERSYARAREKHPTWDIQPLAPFEEFEAKHRKHMKTYQLTAEQFQTAYDRIKNDANATMSHRYGVGDNFSPRPILEAAARELLKDPSDTRGKTGFRLHDERDEVTYHPFKGVEGNRDEQHFFEFGKFEKEPEGSGNYVYTINARSEGMGNHGFVIVLTEQRDIDLVEKLLTIVKLADDTNGGDWGAILGMVANKLSTGEDYVDPRIKTEDDLARLPQLAEELKAMLDDPEG